MPFISNRGIRIYFEVEGSGPPLVLAHGVSASLEDWRETGWVDALKGRYQLILVDARGHGRSDKPHDPAAYSQFHQAMDHVSVLNEVGAKQAHFLGYSMGGIVSLGAGIHAPDRCLSLMMGGTQPFARGERLAKYDLPTAIPLKGLPDGPDPIIQLLKQGGEAWVAFFEANMEVSASMKARLLQNDFDAVIARFEAMYESSLSDHLAPVQMPCLIYVGEDEYAYGGAKQLANLLPNARFVAFPGFNHYEMFTSIDVVHPLVLQFLREVG